MPEIRRRPARRVLSSARFLLLALALSGGATFEASAQAPADRRASRGRIDVETPLKPGDGGAAVEDLQRRLNRALEPSPGLDDDGDYGDATRAAVARFQRSKGIAPTGTADAETRRALGTERLPEPPVPAPEVVNAEVQPKKPADPLDGPPFVSAKAWAIADGRTGEVLWGDRQDEPLPMASTTKMMTALVVARLLEREPAALGETVTFSERADKTAGSTSGVRAGEKVPVEELLYGMMLPSGNDATVAFGEHFGGRVEVEGDEADPLARFVAAMNRTAGEIGLAGSHFTNTHGLPDPDHNATAGDLARLASHVLKDPTLAKVVSTPKRGCKLVDAEGNERNVVWTNTNRLLGTEGYDGVKTGTTNAAGNCLVASGRRGDDHLIVVILGAPTTDARYLDARNLFRYGWTRRGHVAPTPAGD
ncbi:peptidoglycan-binding protein [Paludisphaera soli]|uniref:peptidoglycan-binding protein n=1 Tax=Paludisphaera soli TaxID=2712865 RepID=UPI0013EA27C3|nr:peptidoglycan-binding protein [Paludisphaera soli]